ncbi:MULTISPECIES: hypothetical protein [unclassified Sedimentibacter]|uniref:hypothetical protein n=1 Tax=unclassified Sedimentibacter TaxID=2649220 RepID=UPI0027E040C2|nr:hypothetical protein [Sedimentibacter sp. MB35-C1]WMJ78466.1 hypothetical protein RBQ61_05970 [Sedimentibacter sp. MB35-C1]
MSKLKEADFYYGSVLSTLFTNHITPVLIENDKDRQVYDYSTDKGDFRAYIKYRTSKKNLKSDNYFSWDFVLTNDIDEIKKYIDDNYNIVLFLVCGSKNLKESELAILNKDEIKLILSLNKQSITISRKKGEKAFRISIGGGRDKAMPIKSSRKLEDVI